MFSCSYCGVVFHEYHHDVECRDRLLETIYNKLIDIDKQRLKLILNYINLISL